MLILWGFIMKILRIILFFSIILTVTSASALCPNGAKLQDINNSLLYLPIHTMLNFLSMNIINSNNVDNWKLSLSESATNTGTICTYTFTPPVILTVGDSLLAATPPAILPAVVQCTFSAIAPTTINQSNSYCKLLQ